MLDVAIIGGGPAGSTAATLLAARGLDVTVFEREQFPREHVGESLLPATLQVLEQLGVLPAIEAEGFTKKFGATMLWGESSEPWSWYFAETNARFKHSYQVSRPRFDEILLQHSAAAGARIAMPERVLEVLFDGEQCTGVRTAGGDIAARLVIDASGQGALLAKQLDLLDWDDEFSNLAAFAYFRGGRHLDPPDQGNIFIESFADGWSWTIPLRDGVQSVGVVVDRDRSVDAIRNKGREGFFADALAQTSRTRNLLAGAEQIRDVSVLRDWSYCARSLHGDGWALAGDAACFVDPLFSTGVHLAITAGYLVAAHASTVLGDSDVRDSGAAYSALYLTQFRHFHELARLFYSGNRTEASYFWEARRITGDRTGAREAFIRAVSGQSAVGYERSVLSHGALPASMADALSELEAARVVRRSAWSEIGEPMLLRPQRAPGVGLRRGAVLGEGEFVTGSMLSGPGREDLPVSDLVMFLAQRANGKQTLSEIAAQLAEAVGSSADRAELDAVCVAALELLVLDGLVNV